MGLNSYDIIYLLSNTFGTYTVFKFMNVFFDRNRTNKNIEAISYIMYFFIIGAIHIFYNTPIVNLLANLVLFYILTLNYSSTLKSRLAAIVYIYTILLSVETVTILISSAVNINKFSKGVDIELIMALINSKILSYVVVLALSNFKMVKSRINIPRLHWIAVFVIPIGTLFSTFILMTEADNNNFIFIFLSIGILFAINIFIFYLYDALMKSYQEKMDKQFLQQQNNAYIKQFEIIARSQQNLQLIRHDIKNHIFILQSFLEKNNTEEGLSYLQSVLDSMYYSKEYAKSGNNTVDSILNYKVDEAEKHNIKVDLVLNIPEKLSIKPFDLCVVIGNLFDNAIEATSKLDENRRIEISIELDRNILYINFNNTYDGNLVYKENRLYTTHEDIENHGFGLISIENAIEKYNGDITIEHTERNFNVSLLMYNIIA